MTISSIFSHAWSEATDLYQSGQINSECTLQAFMYTFVRARVSPHIVLCEPRFPIQGTRGFFPDLVVISESHVEAIAEFKFVPHNYPVYETDIEKMQMLSSLDEPISIVLDPATGKFSSKQHKVAENCALIFGVFGKHDAAACDEGNLGSHAGAKAARFTFLTHRCGIDR